VFGAAAAVLVLVVLAIAVAALGAPGGGGTAAPAQPSGTATAPADTCTPPSTGDHQVTVEAGRAPVLLHVPPGTPNGRRSLVIVLPGAGMTGASMAAYTGYSRLADQRGFLVAYPTAAGARPFWNVSGTVPGKPDDVAYLRHVIQALTGSAACADAARVGVTGVSNGGGMSARLACEAADLLAAVAPVAGGYSTLPSCRPQRPLPMLEIHGLRDEVVPYDGKDPDHAGAVGPFVGAWRTRNRCAAPAHRSTPAPRVLELRWTCANGRVVAHDRVIDAEHGWPGEDSLRPFSSTLRTWRFLNAFRNDD
jgi:polyhydroxybutyrate depolymerase